MTDRQIAFHLYTVDSSIYGTAVLFARENFDRENFDRLVSIVAKVLNLATNSMYVYLV